MAKRYNFKAFTVPLKSGEKLEIECSSTDVRDHISRKAECYVGLRFFKGYDRVYNRPWEVFEYESTLQDLAERLPENEKSQLLAYLKSEEKRAHEKAESFLNDFKSEWEKASPGLKSAIQAGGMIETEEQAKSTLAVLKMGNFLRSMENN